MKNILLIIVVATLFVAIVAKAQPLSLIRLYRVSIYKDAKGEFRWRITHRNKNILADSGEGYKNHQDCRSSLLNLISKLESGDYTIAFYKDAKNEIRWRISHKNRNIVADSGEGYRNAGDAYNVLLRLIKALSQGSYDLDDVLESKHEK